MDALCPRCQASRRQQDRARAAIYLRCRITHWQDRTRVAILVLVVIILLVTAVQGWTLADVLAVIMAVTAAPHGAGSLGAAAS